MENQKTQIIERLKEANNILVTVSKNPSVDQLAAAIGMTLVLNKLGKHGTAVFSGKVPSTIEFLQPDQTIEKTTDSLRDFIISLDKSKADKLRYKVEDQHVKIFITPYRTTITEDDLIFSHGDFNVDVVLALGVHEQSDLDDAITAHGRILHDATVVSVNVTTTTEFGSMHFTDSNASSLSEVMADISSVLKGDVFDAQIANAFLTGIVAETDRFSNEKTKPATMQVSAKLMSAGANQQLVATKLEEPVVEEPPQPPEQEPPAPQEEQPKPPERPNDDGSLEIHHTDPHPDRHDIHIDDDGNVMHKHPKPTEAAAEKDTNSQEGNEGKAEQGNGDGQSSQRPLALEPPSRQGSLNSAQLPDTGDQTTDPLSLPPVKEPLLSHEQQVGASKPKPNIDDLLAGTDSYQPKEQQQPQEDKEKQAPEAPVPEPGAQKEPAEASEVTNDTQTLDELERAVDSPHQDQQGSSDEQKPDLDELQQAVNKAIEGNKEEPLEPIAALNANPVHLDLGHDEQPEEQPKQPEENKKDSHNDDYLDVSQIDESTGMPSSVVPPDTGLPQDNTGSSASDPGAPPPVPPPMMPPPPVQDDDDNINLPPVNP